MEGLRHVTTGIFIVGCQCRHLLIHTIRSQQGTSSHMLERLMEIAVLFSSSSDRFYSYEDDACMYPTFES